MSKVSSTNSTISQNASDYKSEIYDYALSALSSLLPNINTVDSESQSDISSVLDSYTQSGVEDINKYYNSELYDMETDSASRFGNLDNSIYLDNLSGLSSERSDAVNSFEQDVQTMQSDLTSDVIDQNYTYADLLCDIINDYYSNSSTSANIYSLLNKGTSNSSSSSSSSSGISTSTVKSLISGLSSLF